MISVREVESTDQAAGQSVMLAVHYDDGTFDIIAAVHDAKSGGKFIRVFPREPANHHVTRASAWLDSGGLSSTVAAEG